MNSQTVFLAVLFATLFIVAYIGLGGDDSNPR